MVTAQLLSAVLMAGVLLVVFLAATRRSRKAGGSSDDRGPGGWRRLQSRMKTAAEDPAVLAVGFLLLAVGMGLGVVAAVGDGFLEGVPVDLLAVVLGATLALVLVAYLFWGTYAASRRRGLGNAQAVGVGVGTLGLLFLAVIAAQLLFGVVG
ncbi:putative membrane protein [Halalkaliarchaeum sp. AArc-CO]|uniref:hypothetical protein n=1 Tax=unclassified Halalkaliarchaeum TaxID=2678344 RepID=UPI00217E1E31|nr:MULTISPECIES: hypothetical protein [unclassified Halalkaliarchaeum]MDR5671780.1 hypothetical protein [Halalkaliarchaeum sp. AArc-GB]UWG51276.1 putative membrane protein [Halalkaliarchaeum sp. AArc-CO]